MSTFNEGQQPPEPEEQEKPFLTKGVILGILAVLGISFYFLTRKLFGK